MSFDDNEPENEIPQINEWHEHAVTPENIEPNKFRERFNVVR
jgi:hypothetical protein